jgi:hypothetical protein
MHFEIGGPCITQSERCKTQTFYSVNLNGKSHVENLNTAKRIIFNLILNEQKAGVQIGFLKLASSEEGNVTSPPWRALKLLNHLSNYPFLKEPLLNGFICLLNNKYALICVSYCYSK